MSSPVPERYSLLEHNEANDRWYTAEELRVLLISGRVRSEDWVRRESDQKRVSLTAVIPDAEDVSGARPSASERIRRTTSDRMAAAQHEPRSSLGVVKIDPDAPDAPVPVVTAPAPQPVAPAAAPSRRRAWLPAAGPKAMVVRGWCLIACVACAAYWVSEDAGTMSGDEIYGRWTRVPPGKAVPPDQVFSLTITHHDLDIASNGQHHVTPYTMQVALADALVLQMATPHATLGTKLIFARGQGSLLLMQGDRGVPLYRVP